MPIDWGQAVRVRYPYGDDLKWQGVHVVGKDHRCEIELVIFYCVCDGAIATGRLYARGEPFGFCQNITRKYSNPSMLPHVHLQIERMDPMRLLTEGLLFDWAKWTPEQWKVG